MSKKITQMTLVTDLADSDWVTGVNNAAADPDKNSRITKANLFKNHALKTEVNTVQGNLDAHEATNAATAHPDGTTLTDLTNHKTAVDGLQHQIAGIAGLQTELDAKANTADLGNSATRDVGVGSGDVAAGDAPANAVSVHDGDSGAHGGLLNTTAQKAALDANPGLSGVNPVAAQGDIPVDEVTGANSVAVSPTTGTPIVSLLNDVAAPGNNRVYGTDASGIKGWRVEGSGGWVDGSTIADWGNTEQALGSLGAGTSVVDLDNGHVITATITADRTFNFTSTAAHGATDWSATIATGGNTPTFQFDAVAITTPPDYDIATGGTYVFFFTRNSLGTFVSERRMA